MNVVDLIIIIFLVGSLVRGYAIGLLRQVGSTIGFVIGLVAGSWVGSLLISHETTTVSKVITGLAAALIGGAICMSTGELLGREVKIKLAHIRPLDRFDGLLGSVMSAATSLFGFWLVASILVLILSGSAQTLLKNSRILSSLNARLPAATSILGSLNKLIDPNDFPQVFAGLEPTPTTSVNLPALGSFGPIVQTAEQSVVKVEGTGCGGIVEGSGFIASTDDVVTNAHVVAGVTSPKIIDPEGHLHNTRVVWFDPNIDLAVLRVSGLTGPPLSINSAEQPANTPGVVLGYPGGGSFNAQPAAVIEHFTALGRNIYDQGSTSRDVYSLKAHIIPGNSGGPLIGSDGSVLGIVFATSTTYNNVGYALTGHQVASELATAEQSNTTYSTGACSE
ncbi:MAG TPA: MarP family serine protease [Verrucomicrobiae bacterium]|nr:MarP family serine protease [Verrucomicrobiae bacterium]